MTLVRSTFLLLLLCAGSTLAAQPAVVAPKNGDPPPRTVALTVGGHKVIAEVADTQDLRQRGLMHRFSLRPDQGMVFVFARPEPLGFWMRNTFIPLSIAFADSRGEILNVEDMAPQSDDTHWSRGPAQYALEMRKGWFRERNVKPGDRIEGLPPAAKE